MIKPIRIITAKGSLQLLNVLAVLKYQLEIEKKKNYHDYLITDVSADARNQKQILSGCTKIASIWPFRKIINLYPVEQKFDQKKLSFKASQEILLEELAIDPELVNYVYTCRNWKFFDELILTTFDKAEKICYGDWGFLDIRIDPKKYQPIDKAYLILPVESTKGSFGATEIKQVPFSYLIKIIKLASNKFTKLKAYCQQINNRVNGKIILVLTSYGDRFFKSPEAETQAYLNRVLAYTTPDDYILVKGHPREMATDNQSTRLVNVLKNHQRRARLINKYMTLPIELFMPFIKIDKALTMTSTACVSFSYYYRDQIDLFFGLDRDNIRKYVSKSWQAMFKKGEAVRSLLVQQALKRQFRPISYVEVEKKAKVYQELPKIFIKGKPVVIKTRSRLIRMIGQIFG